MGRDFCEAYEVSRAVFEEADSALGFSLSKIVFEGPEEELVKTAITQPAILVTSIAALRAAEQEYGKPFAPAFYGGHSLGEYTALVAAGALSLGDAVRLVHKRGALMQDAVPLGEGAMSAVLGMDMPTLDAICREASEACGGIACSPANVNAPSQIVISGAAAAAAKAGEIAKERGATKVIPLKVSAPFHCALMRPVADALREEFAKLTWHDPQVPVAANVDASFLKSVDSIQRALYDQTYSPVLWSDEVQAMTGAGVDAFLEFGPGNVLSGLIKRIAKGAKTAAVSGVPGIAKALELLEGGAA